MSLDVYFRDDVRNVLVALAVGAGESPSAEYRRGYMAALQAVALGFGLGDVSQRGQQVGRFDPPCLALDKSPRSGV